MSVSVVRKSPDALKKIHALMQAACAKEVAIGFPRDLAQAYPDGTSVIDVAAKNCFGVGVPERNFMHLGELYIAQDDKIKDAMKLGAKAASSKEQKASVVTAMQNAAGQQAEALVKKAILDGDWEPNSDATIARKEGRLEGMSKKELKYRSKNYTGGGTKPLIDTGHMINAVTYVVRNKK